MTNQIGGQHRQSIVLTLCPAILEPHVPALVISHFAQALMEREQTVRPQIGRRAAEESDHWRHRLLGAASERPRDHCTAAKGNQVSPLHSNTSTGKGETNTHGPWPGAAVG